MRTNKFIRGTKIVIPKPYRNMYSNGNSFFNNLSKRFKETVLNNLKFRIKMRSNYTALVPLKFYGDEVISLYTDDFHLIKCKKCNCVAQAYTYNRNRCIECLSNLKFRDKIDYNWSSWAKNV